LIHRGGPWRSFVTVQFTPLSWVDWFDNRRSLEPVGDITLAQAESAIARCRTSQPSHLVPER
jgi:hypothetical protein